MRSSTVLISVLFFVISASSFDLKELVRNDLGLIPIKNNNLDVMNLKGDCTTPQLFENINNFTLPLRDVKNLLANQFSRNTISDVKAADKVVLHSIQYQSKLLSDSQSQSYATPLKATVYNDQNQFTFTYQINITEGLVPKTKQFNATTIVKSIGFTYEKQFKSDTGSSTINSVTVKFQPDMMTTTYSPAPTDAQKTKFDAAVKGNTGSLYEAFNKLIGASQVKQFMESNVKGQHLSKIYESNPYNYNYYNFNVSVDVSTMKISMNQQNLLNQLSGKLPTSQYCNTWTPDFSNTQSTMFIPLQFMQNFVSHSIANFPDWKNVKLDKSWVRSNILQFLLPDLQYIVDGIYRDLSDYVGNQMYYTCAASSNENSQLDSSNNVLYQTMKWKCAGFVKINESSSIKVLDFQPRIRYTVIFSVSPGRLDPFADKLEFVDCVFNDVDSFDGKGKYHVMNTKLAQKYIQSTFNDMRRWTVGGFFKVHPQSRKSGVQQNKRGLWIL